MSNKKSIDVADFHAHVLPRADHGSNSTKTSISQLEIARKNGVSRIVATPHFYPHVHTLDAFLEKRNAAYNELLKSKSNDLPEIKLGAEVLLCQGMEKLSGIEKLCFEGTNVLLLELPFSYFKEEYCDSVACMIDMGIDVILAHADRYPHENIESMINAGVSKIQLNASSLSGFIKNKHAYDWMSRGLVVALGSDIHASDEKAYKNFDKAKSKIREHLDFIKNASDNIWDKIHGRE